MPKVEARRICLIRLSAIGDAIHALALANGLRRGYPDAHLTWIIEKVPCDVVREQPAVDRFIEFNARGGIRAWRNLARSLSGERFDLVVVPQVSSKAALVTMMTHGNVRLGFDRKRSREIHGMVINARIGHSDAGHAQDQYLEFLEWLGIDPTPEWNFRFTDEEEAFAAEYFGGIGRPVAGLVVASSHPDKDWPALRYAELAKRIERDFGLQPMLIGGPSVREGALAEQILAACDKPPIVALDRPVRHTMLKLRGCSLVVAPDTGPLHAAVAMNRPTIGLFGCTDPLRTGPYRRFHELLVQKFRIAGEESQPITRKKKKGRMELITVDEVMEKVALAIERYGG